MIPLAIPRTLETRAMLPWVCARSKVFRQCGPPPVSNDRRVPWWRPYPYSDTCRTCFPITKVYGCAKNHLPLSQEHSVFLTTPIVAWVAGQRRAGACAQRSAV